MDEINSNITQHISSKIVLQFIFLFLIFSPEIQLSLSAQSLSPAVIPSDGGANGTAFMNLEWTLGEPAIETYTGVNRCFTEGFNQPIPDVHPNGPGYIITPLPYTEERFTSEDDIYFFPNPVSTTLTIDLPVKRSSNLILSVNLLNGAPVMNKIIQPDENQIQLDFSPMTPGLYFLQIIDQTRNLISHYKVSKN